MAVALVEVSGGVSAILLGALDPRMLAALVGLALVQPVTGTSQQ